MIKNLNQNKEQLQERFHYTHTLQCLFGGTWIIALIQKVIHYFLYHGLLNIFRVYKIKTLQTVFILQSELIAEYRKFYGAFFSNHLATVFLHKIGHRKAPVTGEQH